MDMRSIPALRATSAILPPHSSSTPGDTVEPCAERWLRSGSRAPCTKDHQYPSRRVAMAPLDGVRVLYPHPSVPPLHSIACMEFHGSPPVKRKMCPGVPRRM